MTETAPPLRLKRVRMLLWILVGIVLLAGLGLTLAQRPAKDMTPQAAANSSGKHGFGGPFILVGADGKPFDSKALAGKAYAIFFGYTRCGDICPTTLARLTKLRQQAGATDALNIVFVTIDPNNDGPKEVGQYAELFGTPIIGLTGTAAQIEAVKKQYGIFAEPDVDADGHMKMIDHTATVLLFDKNGNFASTLSPTDPDSAAIAKMKQLVA